MEARIKELVRNISKADDDYYNKSNPQVSDKVYDAWKDELKDLLPKCKNKKLIKQADQVIASIGAMVGVSEWRKVAHDIPMSSLNKVNTPDEFKAWAKECDAKDVFLTEKLDGISINTIWKDGQFVQAITRGDGSIGEDITPNVRKMCGIPNKLKKKFTGSLRGEIILTKSNHNAYFPDYANPRNAASGVAKRFDSSGSEHLTVIMYQVASGKGFKTEKEQFEYLSNLGVKIPWYAVYSDVNKAIEKYKEYHDIIRNKLDYEIDGLVGRVNSLSKQWELGEKNHRPKGAVAFKFDAAGKETTVRNIVWQVGSTGRITPVAEFDTVNLVGANINRASVYNLAYINELGIGVGAKAIIIRSNDVIPVLEEISQPPKKVAEPPDKCPECDGQVELNGEYLRCMNKAKCPAQAVGRLKMWANENGILEFGGKILQKLSDSGLVSDVGDLYRLNVNKLSSLDRMGEKSAKNLIESIDKHRNISLENFIGGLGIDNVATSTAKLVIKAGYDTLDAMYNMSISDFEAIDGFGTIKAQAFYDGLRENKKRINDILDAGVKIKAQIKGKLSKKSFCFTGSMNNPRPTLHKMVEEAGGDIKKSVGKGLDFLVIADPNSTSSKAQAARKLGTKLISEEEFLSML